MMEPSGADWLRQYLAGANDNWAYVNGVVEFGDNYWEIARRAAERAGLDDTAQTYVSNTVARQQLPEGYQVALGTMVGHRPQIWVSNLDRVQAIGAVIDANDQRFVRPSV